MDFSQFDTRKNSEEGVWCPIYSPDGTLQVAEFKLAGRDSKILKRRQQEIAKRNQGKKKITAVEEEQDTYITLALCTLDWRMVEEDDKGNIKAAKKSVLIEGGTEIPCNYENAKEFYERWQYVAEQAIEYIADRSYFLSN